MDEPSNQAGKDGVARDPAGIARLLTLAPFQARDGYGFDPHDADGKSRLQSSGQVAVLTMPTPRPMHGR